MKKINGFSQPYQPYQIFTYILFTGCFFIYFLIIFPLSSDIERIVGGILEGVSGAVVLISFYICSATDTTDTLLIQQKQLKKEGRDTSHIVTEHLCRHDRAYVKPDSKHCRRCGRCTEGFDHHCKWINNDIGKRNYKSFVTMITSVALFLLIFIIFGAIVTGRFAKENDFAFYDIWIFTHDKGDIIGGMIVLWLFMIVALLFFLLDLNLVLFHYFLISKGLTTFQYITLVEERKEYKREMEIAMAVLGKKRKTPLDFILCLKSKKKHNRAQTASAPLSGEKLDPIDDSPRKDDQIPLGKSEKELYNGLVQGEELELAEKKTALEFFPKSDALTEGNDLLGRSPDTTPQVLSLRGLGKSEDNLSSPDNKKKLLAKEESTSSKSSFLVINLDKNKESGNLPAIIETPNKAFDFEEVNNEDQVNDVKNEKDGVDNDQHLPKEDESSNSKSSEATENNKKIRVYVNTPANDSDRNRRAITESRHNNYFDVKDSEEKPSFYKERFDMGDVKQRMGMNNEAINKDETVAHREGSKINPYKEVEGSGKESNLEGGDQIVEGDRYIRASTLAEQTEVKELHQRTNSKELEVEFIS